MNKQYIKNIIYKIELFFVIKLFLPLAKYKEKIKPTKKPNYKLIMQNSELSSRKKLCIFVHFDKDNLIDDYVIYYLKTLFQSGCALVFITSCWQMQDNQYEKIRSFCFKILCKENEGYDFWSYRLGIMTTENIQTYEQIILANDSVYGPLYDLPTILDKLTKENYDMCGISENNEYTRHIQSYFILFNNKIIKESFFIDFWHSMPMLDNKWDIIHCFEIGLNVLLKRHKKRISSYISLNGYRTKILLNPLIHDWRELLSNYYLPFIKVQLLRDNPTKEINLTDWETIVAKSSTYDINLIKNHLKRIQEAK